MKHFNKFKNKLRNENEVLPEGFGWDDMSQGILEKVDEGKPVATNSLVVKNILIGVLSIGVLVLIILLTKKCDNSKVDSQSIVNQNTQEEVQSKSNENVDTDNVVSSEILDNSQKAIVSNTEENKIIDQEIIGNQNVASSIGIIEEVNIPVAIENLNTANVLSSENIISEDIKFKQTSNDIPAEFDNDVVKAVGSSNMNSIQTNDSSTENPTTQDLYVELNEVNKSTNNIIEIESQKEFNTIQSIVLLPLTPSNRLEIERREIEVRDVAIQLTEKSDSEKEKRFSLAFAGGVNIASFGNLPNDHAHALNENILGSNFSLNANYLLTDNFGVSVGSTITDYRTRIDANITKLENRAVEDAVVGHTINPISGVQTAVVQDTFVVDTLLTRIVHHNSFRTISLPIMVNFRNEINTWAYGIGIGPSVDFLVSYAGKYQLGEEIFEFDSTKNQYDNSIGFSLHSNLFVEKQLFEDWFVGANLGLSKSLTSFSTSDQFSMKPVSVSSQLYIKYVF